MDKSCSHFVKIILAIIISFFLICQNNVVYSKTNNEISGIIQKNTILNTENGPYLVKGNITIPEGITLTINNGVTLIFTSNTSIDVEGNLIVNGIYNSHVIFKSLGKEKWDKVIINSNNNIIKYLDIDNAKEGLEITKDENTVYNINMTNSYYNLKFYDKNSINNIIPKAAVTAISDYDINKDSKINILDLISIAASYNKKTGDIGYESCKDLNKDNIININDLVLLSKQLSYSDFSLYGRKIFIDSGHGGTDPGAVQNGYIEKNVNLSLALKLKNELINHGAVVVMSRDSDVTLSLDQRVNMANAANADLFLSIHHNSSTSSAPVGMSTHYSTYRPAIETKDDYAIYNGVKFPYISEQNGSITFNYYGTPKTASYSSADITVYDPTPCSQAIQSKTYSQSIVNALSSLGFENDGIKDHNLYVTRWPKMTSVLIEAGYLSNAAEAAKVTSSDMELEMAEKIASGIK